VILALSGQRLFLILLLGLLLVGLVACTGPISAPDMRATETSIAEEIIIGLTANAPRPSATATRTLQSTSTVPGFTLRPPTLTPTPATARAVVEAQTLNLREGPDRTYPVVTGLEAGATVTVLGQYQECTWLEVRTRRGENGWVRAGEGFARLQGDCRVLPSGTFRPVNGAIIYDQRERFGLSELTVENGSPLDVLVVLAYEGVDEPLVAFYVRYNEVFTLPDMPDGRYNLYVMYGRDWVGDEKEFEQIQSVREMIEPVEFITTNVGYTAWTVRMAAISENDGSTRLIPRRDFPVIN
jgi:hypothetical protein